MIALHSINGNELIHVSPGAILAIRGESQGSMLEIACRAGGGKIEIYHVREAPKDILSRISRSE
jgi:hypothetical protein